MAAESLSSALDVFKTKAPALVGVDVSSTSVKMVELSSAGKGGFRLERYAIEPLPKDVVTDGNIANLDQVADALRRAFKRLGSRNRNVALALPAAMVITKKIIVPAGQKEDDLELTVEAEANQYIPFALDEVNLDFQILGQAPTTADEVEVLIAASRKEKVEDRVAAAEACGLKPRVMDVESYATQEAFQLIGPSLPANGRDQNIALVDIGAHVSHFYVLRNNQFLFSRDQAFGGNQLTQDIQRAFNLSAEEAESAKKNQGLPESYEGEVLQPFMETLALEITRALQFFFTSTSYNQVDQIVLAGGCALLPGLDDLVSKRAGVGTIVANPFVNMHASERIRPRQLALDAPMLLIATGLAMPIYMPGRLRTGSRPSNTSMCLAE
jgi:type IV pilus assembly protein PilM